MAEGSTTEPKINRWWQTIPGILAALATFITAVSGLLLALNQVGVLKVTNDVLPSTSSTSSDSIPFALPDSPTTLNPAFGWYLGGSNASGYELEPTLDSITLYAGPETDHWEDRNSAPLLLFPVEGNFDAQVKVVINSKRNYQFAGLGVRAAQDDGTWIRIDRGFYNEQLVGGAAMLHGKPSPIGGELYPNDTVYLKIERRHSRFTLKYSTDAIIWSTVTKDYILEMPSDVQVYLLVLSSENNEVVAARFSDFRVANK